jgi:hypothetical protein
MKLENQVVSLELSKKLKELGIKHESIWHWQLINTPHPRLTYNLNPSEWSGDYRISAFTSSELIEMTPQYIDTKQNEPFNNFMFNLELINIFIEEKLTRVCSVNYNCNSCSSGGIDAWLRRKLYDPIFDENLSNALAKNIIYLIENKYMEISIGIKTK